MKEKKPIDVYQMVTDQIIKQLENGVVPWKKPWATAGAPMNLISQKPYRGINILLLASLGYAQNYFLSYKQVKELGGSIKKDEKPAFIVFWKWIEVPDADTVEETKVPFLRYHLVYNIAQCDGLRESSLPVNDGESNDPIAMCEVIIQQMPKVPEIRFKENKAYYSMVEDFINMPKLKSFVDSESYYATLFHELIHSTGHQSRLFRKELMELKPFGSPMYSVEELVAEMGSCYLQSFAGIAKNDLENSAAYIQGWLRKLKSDKKFIVYASTQGQKAADFILNQKPVSPSEKVEESVEESDDLPF